MELSPHVRVLGTDDELELAHWQGRAHEAEQINAQLEAAMALQAQQLGEALQKVEVLTEDLQIQQARAENAEAEIVRLHEWVEYSEQLTPAYETAVQQLEAMRAEQDQAERLRSVLEEQINQLTLEVEALKREGAAPPPPPALLPTAAEPAVDPVTGLPNYQHGLAEITRLLGEAQTGGAMVALARIDIHRLRDLNLFLGTFISDQILGYFATRFRALLAEGQQLIRGRDDEFWVLLTCSSQGPVGARMIADQINQLFQRLGVALKRPFDVEDHAVHLNLSCGVACSLPGQTEAGELLECAGLALERSKTEPHSRLVYFQPEMQQRVKARMQRVPQLRQAVERAELELHFQPMVQLDTLQIQAVESLLRWNHPQDGILLPGQFIEAALESGAIVGIGEWVVGRVCQLTQEGDNPYLWSVNVSASELVQAHFMRRFVKAVEAAHLKRPEQLVVEVSEAGLANLSERLLAPLRELRKWRVRLAIDDFTFDKLTLRKLQSLDVSYLKLSHEVTHHLDQSLFRNLVQGAVLAAEGLGCKVVAEGIESTEQLDILRELGCHWGQGHVLQPPAPLHELRELLAF